MNEFELSKSIYEKLHTMPEKSGNEVKTKAFLMDYLAKASDLEITDMGHWFYAVHHEDKATESIAFRCDMDGVTADDGSVFHGCGHDGHMSVATALAMWAIGKSFGKNIYFIYQHAEENGAGGKECAEILQSKDISRVYAFHNCPGFETGHVLVPENSFACASLGLIISFEGAQTHAAYPENGHNPIYPMARLIDSLSEITKPDDYQGLVMVTAVEFNSGSRAFGLAAGSGEIGLTLRAWLGSDLKILNEKIRRKAEEISANYNVKCSFFESDVFPSTENCPELKNGVLLAAQNAGLISESLSEPFRWSEDFGWYGQKTKAFMFGIGAGKNAAGLHTSAYHWNTDAGDAAIKLFKEIIKL